MNKTIKVPFEIILRNKKTKSEMKVGDINIPIKVHVDKKQLHKIMKENVAKENSGDEQEE